MLSRTVSIVGLADWTLKESGLSLVFSEHGKLVDYRKIVNIMCRCLIGSGFHKYFLVVAELIPANVNPLLSYQIC